MAKSTAANSVLIRFDDGEALALVLADAIASDLREALRLRGQALLALAGGSTPRRFLQRLSEQPLEWSRVTVTLIDERWVGADDPRSNQRLLREQLLRGPAAAARLLPLYQPTPTPESALPALNAEFSQLPLPFDAMVLGMGTDGHFASLFPGGDQLSEGLDANRSPALLAMRAAGAGEPRVSMNLSLLLRSRAHYLHIEGAQKMRVFECANDSSASPLELPLRALLRTAAQPIKVFWCP